MSATSTPHNDSWSALQAAAAAAAVQADQKAGAAVTTATIIHLNNIAIALLMRGGCRCAVDTFKDALELLKTTTTDPSYASRAMERAEHRRQQNRATSSPEASSNLVVLDYDHNPQQAYQLLSEMRTSKVCLTMRTTATTTNDPTEARATPLSAPLVRAVLVYNYGIAHRCCVAPDQSAANLGSFCVQIFQYAESLLPPSANLLFRLILTRNLMMLSCRLGMSLCELYKETLDPIVMEITGPPTPDGEEPPKPAAA